MFAARGCATTIAMHRPDPLLIGESFSPWTQKAHWALEHCGVAHRYEEYVPTLHEPRLRWRMRQWSGPMSVPVLQAHGQWLRGSWAIACLRPESRNWADYARRTAEYAHHSPKAAASIAKLRPYLGQLLLLEGRDPAELTHDEPR